MVGIDLEMWWSYFDIVWMSRTIMAPVERCRILAMRHRFLDYEINKQGLLFSFLGSNLDIDSIWIDEVSLNWLPSIPFLFLMGIIQSKVKFCFLLGEFRRATYLKRVLVLLTYQWVKSLPLDGQLAAKIC